VTGPAKWLRAEDGVTLIELLIAMVVMSVGVAALVAGFSSGILSIRRAHLAATSAALADRQMELYRKATFTALTPGALSGATQTGSDGRTYWVGATISWTCVVGPANTTTAAAAPTCTGTPASRPVKLVAVEVHQGSTSAAPLLFSESATFDSSTA
jgi:prepilin-type N-terminal cleavage/methylation domain-containing protein